MQTSDSSLRTSQVFYVSKAPSYLSHFNHGYPIMAEGRDMSPYVLLAVLCMLPLLVIAANKKLCAGRLSNVSLAAVSAASLYVFVLLSVLYVHHKLESELAAFDLNGDGIFTEDEITPQQEAAMERLVSDTGRTLAPITGAVASMVYFFGVWIGLSILDWLFRFRRGRLNSRRTL